jgi:aspartate aminotransferase
VHARLSRIPGVRCLLPGGAFYLFPDCSALYGRRFEGRPVSDSATLAEMLLDSARVAVVPGAAFGEDRCERISYSTSLGILDKAVDRIESFVARLS